jgi:hypothetical protein
MPFARWCRAEGGVELLSHFGRVVSLTGAGRWRSASLLPRLRTTLGDRLPEGQFQLEVLDVQSAGDGRLVLVVSSRGPGGRLGEAVVTLGRDGDDHLVAFHGPDDPEILAACAPAK